MAKKKKIFLFKPNQPFIIDRDGYKYVPITTEIPKDLHPMFIRGYAPEHRLILAKELNRLLKKTEHVHHKDHNRLNNLRENLELIDALQHINDHKIKGNLKLFSSKYQPKRRPLKKKQSLLNSKKRK